MSKCRVWYRADGGISVSYPDVRPQKKPIGMTMEEWIVNQLDDIAIKAPKQFGDLEYDDMDTSDLPQDKTVFDKWRGAKGQGVYIDHSVVLRKDIEDERDVLLDKSNPTVKDSMDVIKAQRRIENRDYYIPE